MEVGAFVVRRVQQRCVPVYVAYTRTKSHSVCAGLGNAGGEGSTRGSDVFFGYDPLRRLVLLEGPLALVTPATSSRVRAPAQLLLLEDPRTFGPPATTSRIRAPVLLARRRCLEAPRRHGGRPASSLLEDPRALLLLRR